MRQNTLNLVGDGDDLDVISDAEDIFEVKLVDREVSAVESVGELYDLIVDKYRSRHPITQACLSQTAFYRLRSALDAMGAKGPIRPATSVSLMMSQLPGNRHIRHKWRELARRSGLKLPRLEVRWMPFDVVVPRYLCYLRSAAVILIFFLTAYAISKLAGMTFGWALIATFTCFIFVSTISWLWFADIPLRIKTIGDLAHESSGHSFTALRREKPGCSPVDLWQALVAILRGISGRKGEINRDTTFFAQHAADKR
jgi:hypothetical protein